MVSHIHCIAMAVADVQPNATPYIGRFLSSAQGNTGGPVVASHANRLLCDEATVQHLTAVRFPLELEMLCVLQVAGSPSWQQGEGQGSSPSGISMNGACIPSSRYALPVPELLI